MANCLDIYNCIAIGELEIAGMMPRRLNYSSFRYMTDKVAPGNKVTVVGVYSIRKAMKPPKVSVMLEIFLNGLLLKWHIFSGRR